MTWNELPDDFRALCTRHLTPRQLQVVKLEADGMTVRYTARRLNITTSTVQGHRAAARERLRTALEQEGEAAA